jgi:hypothetical protein
MPFRLGGCERSQRTAAMRPASRPLRSPPAGCRRGRTANCFSKDEYRTRISDICASEMVRLLNLGKAGDAGFVRHGDRRQLGAIAPGRSRYSGQQSDRVRRHSPRARTAGRSQRLPLRPGFGLQEPSGPSSCNTGLPPAPSPTTSDLLRAALATATLELSWSELDALNHDELAWEARVLQFRGYRDCWRRQGVLPMLRRLLNDFGVPGKTPRKKQVIAGQLDGEPRTAVRWGRTRPDRPAPSRGAAATGEQSARRRACAHSLSGRAMP